jgi:hypothetical protein
MTLTARATTKRKTTKTESSMASRQGAHTAQPPLRRLKHCTQLAGHPDSTATASPTESGEYLIAGQCLRPAMWAGWREGDPDLPDQTNTALIADPERLTFAPLQSKGKYRHEQRNQQQDGLGGGIWPSPGACPLARRPSLLGRSVSL